MAVIFFPLFLPTKGSFWVNLTTLRLGEAVLRTCHMFLVNGGHLGKWGKNHSWKLDRKNTAWLEWLISPYTPLMEWEMILHEDRKIICISEAIYITVWNIYGNLMRGLTIKRSEQTIWQVLTSQYVMNACVLSRIKARTFEHVFVRRHIVVWRVPLCGFLSKTHQRHPQQYLEDHLRKSPHWTLMREDEKCWHQKIRTVWKHATSFLLN